MKNYELDHHICLLLFIMLTAGAFGGYLNYLNNFDTLDETKDQKRNKFKYILLGIGAAFLVPLFLKMIASNLLTDQKTYENCNYLFFAGFCLIASIFSRRFISTIGEKILETAKRAERIASESKQKAESTQKELSNTQDRIEDVKLAVDVNTRQETIEVTSNKEKSLKELNDLADSYISKTSIPNYGERVKLKAEFGRKMGEIIVRNQLPKEELLSNSPNEGMFLALAYSVQLRPDSGGLSTLNKISPKVSQLYTKFAILVGYKTLARNSFIIKENVRSIYDIIIKFKDMADQSLLKNIDETIKVLKLIDPDIE